MLMLIAAFIDDKMALSVGLSFLRWPLMLYADFEY